MPQFNLSELVRDLMSQRDLRMTFNRNPERVMQEYGLTNTERHILYKMDPALIGPELLPPLDTQIGGFNIPVGEFSPEGPNCIPDPGIALPAYPIPKPALFRVRPRVLTPNDVIDVVTNNITTRFVEFIVYGQSFSRNPPPDISVVNQATGVAMPIDSTDLFGTMRCSQLRVLARLQGNASDLGTYDIQLTNSPGTASPDVIQNQLTLRLSNN